MREDALVAVALDHCRIEHEVPRGGADHLRRDAFGDRLFLEVLRPALKAAGVLAIRGGARGLVA